jgi:calcium-binding protein CML
MDNTITTYESEQLFLLADESKNGKVSLDEFYELFCNIDYRSSEDIASRRVQEIISLAQARNIQLRQFFEMFDTDQSNTIDLK